jgi:uncharacterized delta-60 repeat protein
MVVTAGLVDENFPHGIGYGFQKNVHDIRLQPDGKIIIAGDFTDYLYSGVTYNSTYLIRLNSDGTVDTSFDIMSGSAGFDDSVKTIHIQNDGKIIVGGDFTQLVRNSITYTLNHIVRFNSDGSVDTSFSGGTRFDDSVNKVEVQDDGKIVVGGKFTSYDGQSYNSIIRLYGDGTIDPTFIIGTGITGTPPNQYVNDVLKDGDKLLVVGSFSSYNGNSVNNIVRILSNGSIDPTFDTGTGFNGITTSIGIQSTGHIVVGGQFTEFNGIDLDYGNIVRLKSDGSFSNSLSSGLNNTVITITIQEDDRILVGGFFIKYYTSPSTFISAPKLIRFIGNGNYDDSFYLNQNYNDGIYAITLTNNDDYIFIGGELDYPPFNHFGKLYNNALITISANTEYKMCVICSGETSTVIPPHAIYSDGKGRNIVQLNTVALGGPNGLYN